MPRPPRIDLPDAVYHVTSRGNGRADVFHSDEDRQRFLAQLADHLQLSDVQFYADVLMDNHFHLLLRTARANLSRFMQRLLSSYALDARYDPAFAGLPPGVFDHAHGYRKRTCRIISEGN